MYKHKKILILNDQGGAVMSVEYDVSPTLRAQDHGHPPCVLLFEPRSQDGVPRIHGDICPTLNTAQGGQRQPCVLISLNTASTNNQSNQ